MTEVIDRIKAVLIGAIITACVVKLFSYYHSLYFPNLQAVYLETIHETEDVLLLLFGMMIMIGILAKTGLFQWFAVKTYEIGGGSLWKIAFLLFSLTALLSTFLNNVTIILLMIPVTMELSSVLRVSAAPLIIGEIIASNIGGTATLIGDPPNIIIGGMAHLSFLSFVLNLGPIVFLILFIFIFIHLKLFYSGERRERQISKDVNIEELREKYRITDPSLFKRSTAVLSLVLLLFVFYDKIHISVGFASVLGATIMLTLTNTSLKEALEDVEWPSLLFFTALFVIVGGAKALGLIDAIADGTYALCGGSLAVAIILLLWVSGLASAFLDNVPTAATMAAVVSALSGRFDPYPLYWAVALGTCLGGNATSVGAAANVVAIGVCQTKGCTITFRQYLKVGLPITLLSLLISTVYLLLRYAV